MNLLPTWMDGLSPELLKRAESELGETPKMRANALLELRKMINDDPNFIFSEDDSFLVRFLRVKKYNAKKSFRSLKNYYEFKSKDPGLMTETVKDIIHLDYMLIPPFRALDGGTIGIIYLGLLDLQKYSLEQYFKAAIICFEQIAEVEANQVCGTHLIIDLKGITLKKMMSMVAPTFLVQVIKNMEDCWPHRIKNMVVVNEPFYINIAYNICMPLLSAKLRERVSFLGSNLTNLHKKFPREVLPKRLGGVLGQETCVEFKEKTISSQLEIERLNKYSFLRPQKLAKKLSTCGLEENTGFTQPTKTTIAKVAI